MRQLLVAVGMIACLYTVVVFLSGQNSDFEEVTMKDGTTIEFRLTAPEQERESYPFLLALPPGPQTRGTVDWGWRVLYKAQATERGWVVVSPVAPGGRLFFQGSEKYLPELIEQLSRRYPLEGGKVHLAGVSNGGLASFRVANGWPQLFHSIAVLPGWPGPDLLRHLDRIVDIPLKMWVGEKENKVRFDLMRQARSALLALGGTVELEIRPGEGHTITSLFGGEELFDYLERHRPTHESPESRP